MASGFCVAPLRGTSQFGARWALPRAIANTPVSDRNRSVVERDRREVYSIDPVSGRWNGKREEERDNERN